MSLTVFVLGIALPATAASIIVQWMIRDAEESHVGDADYRSAAWRATAYKLALLTVLLVFVSAAWGYRVAAKTARCPFCGASAVCAPAVEPPTPSAPPPTVPY